MLQFNTQAGTELFEIELIPEDAQLSADCFRLVQAKNLFFGHNIKRITGLNAGELVLPDAGDVCGGRAYLVAPRHAS